MRNRGTIASCNPQFSKGDEIEVLKNAGDDNVPVWFPATVIDSPSPTGTLHVKFDTLYVEKSGNDDRRRKRKKIREYVDVNDGVTRLVQPADSERRFVVGEEVEVFHENGWWRGEVKEVLEDLKYKVVIGGAVEVVVENCRIRVYRDWKQADGSWISSSVDPQQETSSQLGLQLKKTTKLRIKCTPRSSKALIFQKGALVEVKSNEQGYQGSWYTATVVGEEKDRLLVQYHTLKTDDEMQPLVEFADASNLRPIPPTITRIDCFQMLEEVDAWYNDGWWVGVVSKVLVRKKYALYFWTTNEVLEFEHSKLRPHQEFIDDKWVASFLRPKLTPKLPPKKVVIDRCGRTLMSGLLRGLKVEVAHGEQGHLTTWYPAVILAPVSVGKYLIEYQTLKHINKSALITEEVHVLCIRPCPPIIQRTTHFQPNDEVDAWHENAWRIGVICTTIKDFKYTVYFKATNNVVEFQHANLRPRQDFIDGQWFVANKGVPE